MAVVETTLQILLIKMLQKINNGQILALEQHNAVLYAIIKG